MTAELRRRFDQAWCVDFEFREIGGNLPEVHCLVAREIFSGRLIRSWLSKCQSVPCPIPLGRSSVYIAYFSTAELKCHLSLGWPLPKNIVDLFVEFRCQTNGLSLPTGRNLLGALTYFGLTGISYLEKETMRELAVRGSPFSNAESEALLNYCQTDVDALEALIQPMFKQLNLGQALLRGRYMKAVASMEHYGIPIDAEKLLQLQTNWEPLKERLIQQVDRHYGVFEDFVFKRERFVHYLAKQKIPWPLLPSGQLDLKDETFRQQARAYPKLLPLKELRQTLGRLRLHQLELGSDQRARVNLSPFRSKTGRNQPGTSRYIFGNAKWLRGLIKPPEGQAIAYIDWKQQEFGIAAALSRDPAMLAAYSSGDPYLEFAKQAGLVPETATKQSHPEERKLCKAAVLAVQYGMGPESLASGINQPVQMGRELLANHRRTFPRFWKWSEAVVDYALLHRKLWTVFGWEQHLGPETNPRSLANFPMQANGAEILRLACCYLVEADIRVCAPVHDAVLIEVPIQETEEQVSRAQKLMARASRDVLSGFELGTDVEIFRYPDRYSDGDSGQAFWEVVMAELGGLGNNP